MKHKSLLAILLSIILISTVPSSTAVLPSMVGTIGSSGAGSGQFDGPQDIFVYQDRIYVSEVRNDRIQIFDLDWNYIDQFGSYGSGNGQFVSPYGISTDGTYLYIADYYNHRIQRFSLDGEFVDEFGTLGNGLGEFEGPIDIIIENGKIFVAEYVNDRIQVFNHTTFDTLYFINATSGIEDITNPSSMAIHNNMLYVVDSFNNMVKIYNANSGEFIDYIEPSIQNSLPWVVNLIEDRIYVSYLDNFLEVYDFSRNYLGEIRSDFHDVRNIAKIGQSLFVAEYDDDEISQFRIVATPTDVRAVAGYNGISLTWNIHSDEGLTEPSMFNIYRESDSKVEHLGKTTDYSFIDITPEYGKNYEYKVQAVSNMGMSENTTSNSVSFGPSTNTTATEDDESFFDSVPISFLPMLSVLLLVPLLRRYRS